jgi:hypothetical protein
VTDRSPGRLLAAPRSALRTGSGASLSTTAGCVRLSPLGERLVQATRVRGYQSPRARDLGDPTLDSVALGIWTVPASRYRSRCPHRGSIAPGPVRRFTHEVLAPASQHSGAVGPEHCFHEAAALSTPHCGHRETPAPAKSGRELGPQPRSEATRRQPYRLVAVILPFADAAPNVEALVEPPWRRSRYLGGWRR